MRHPLMLVSLSLLLSLLTATSLAAQSRAARRAPSPVAACLLSLLAAEGFRLSPPDSSGAEPLLTRSLTGIDARTGMPDPGSSGVQLLEVRIDSATPGLVLERAFVLRPQVGDQSAFAAESERLDRDIRAWLRDAKPHCTVPGL